MDGKQKERDFVTVGRASVLTGLDIQTIRKMADQSTIVCYRTPSGQRRINLQSIQKMCSPTILDEKEQTFQKQNFIYARVSTKEQLDELPRQVELLRRPEYSSYVLIEDIGYGTDFKRKGLSSILDSCIQNNIGEIVVAHSDRLSSAGFDLIESLVTKAGGKITILNNSQDNTHEHELRNDSSFIVQEAR